MFPHRNIANLESSYSIDKNPGMTNNLLPTLHAGRYKSYRDQIQGSRGRNKLRRSCIPGKKGLQRSWKLFVGTLQDWWDVDERTTHRAPDRNKCPMEDRKEKLQPVGAKKLRNSLLGSQYLHRRHKSKRKPRSECQDSCTALYCLGPRCHSRYKIRNPALLWLLGLLRSEVLAN